MDSDPKKIMQAFEERAFYQVSSRQEVKKFVEEGGMEKYEKVNGVYRDKDDVDGSKDRKRKRISTVFWIGLVVVILVGAVVIGVMMENGTLDSSGSVDPLVMEGGDNGSS